MVYNVYKFMKTESEVGITIPLSKVQKRVTETTHVSRRTLCRVLKEGENVGNDVAMAFSTPRKLRPNVCTKSILDNFYEAVLRRIVHNFLPHWETATNSEGNPQQNMRTHWLRRRCILIAIGVEKNGI